MIFIFLTRRMRATVPLIRMLSRPAIHCRHTQTGCSQSYKNIDANKPFTITAATTSRLTCDPCALIGMYVRLLPHGVRRRGRSACRLDFQRVLLQVLLDDIQVHLRAGGGSRSTPGPPISTQPSDVCHLTHIGSRRAEVRKAHNATDERYLICIRWKLVLRFTRDTLGCHS